MALIEIDDVTLTVGRGPARRQALDAVSVRLEEQRIGVVGANGSGKSSFARLLNGLVLPTTGRVRVDGLDTRTEGREVRRRVGFCFTDPDAQIVMPTVAEDVAFGLGRLGLDRATIDARVAQALSGMGLAHLADNAAHTLSGGEKQLLALCSVLVTEPRVLVLDEPTTLLDLRNATRVAGVVAGLPQQVVLVTHQLDLLEGYDRVLVFDEGRLVADDVPDAAVAAYRGLMA